MSFINQYNQSTLNVKKSFNVEEFNANFIKQQKNKQQITINQFMDPKFNYTDPNAPNYVNPERDSPNRASCLIVLDKHRKKFLSVWKINGSYDIPGGKCKIIETYEDAAIRELKEETGIIVEKINMIKILEANDGQFNVITYLAQKHTGNINTNEKHIIGWVPLKYLNYNRNPRWQKYNQIVYEKILSMMY